MIRAHIFIVLIYISKYEHLARNNNKVLCDYIFFNFKFNRELLVD